MSPPNKLAAVAGIMFAVVLILVQHRTRWPRQMVIEVMLISMK